MGLCVIGEGASPASSRLEMSSSSLAQTMSPTRIADVTYHTGIRTTLYGNDQATRSG